MTLGFPVPLRWQHLGLAHRQILLTGAFFKVKSTTDSFIASGSTFVNSIFCRELSQHHFVKGDSSVLLEVWPSEPFSSKSLIKCLHRLQEPPELSKRSTIHIEHTIDINIQHPFCETPFSLLLSSISCFTLLVLDLLNWHHGLLLGYNLNLKKHRSPWLEGSRTVIAKLAANTSGFVIPRGFCISPTFFKFNRMSYKRTLSTWMAVGIKEWLQASLTNHNGTHCLRSGQEMLPP